MQQKQWYDVTAIKIRSEIRINVGVICDTCGEVAPVSWQGVPVEKGKGLIFPKFPQYFKCQGCGKNKRTLLPKKSVLMWWYLGRLAAIECLEDDMEKYVPGRSQSLKKRQRPEIKAEKEARRQAWYAILLKKAV